MMCAIIARALTARIEAELLRLDDDGARQRREAGVLGVRCAHAHAVEGVEVQVGHAVVHLRRVHLHAAPRVVAGARPLRRPVDDVGLDVALPLQRLLPRAPQRVRPQSLDGHVLRRQFRLCNGCAADHRHAPVYSISLRGLLWPKRLHAVTVSSYSEQDSSCVTSNEQPTMPCTIMTGSGSTRFTPRR